MCKVNEIIRSAWNIFCTNFEVFGIKTKIMESYRKCKQEKPSHCNIFRERGAKNIDGIRTNRKNVKENNVSMETLSENFKPVALDETIRNCSFSEKLRKYITLNSDPDTRIQIFTSRD